MKRKQLTIRLTEDLVEQIDERATRYGLIRSRWIEMALRRMAEMPAQVTTKQERF